MINEIKNKFGYYILYDACNSYITSNIVCIEAKILESNKLDIYFYMSSITKHDIGIVLDIMDSFDDLNEQYTPFGIQYYYVRCYITDKSYVLNQDRKIIYLKSDERYLYSRNISEYLDGDNVSNIFIIK